MDITCCFKEMPPVGSGTTSSMNLQAFFVHRARMNCRYGAPCLLVLAQELEKKELILCLKATNSDLLRSHLGSRYHSNNLDPPEGPLFFTLWLVPFGTLSFADVAAAVQTLDRSSQDDVKEGDHQTADQPDVNHLHIRGGGAAPQSCW